MSATIAKRAGLTGGLEALDDDDAVGATTWPLSGELVTRTSRSRQSCDVLLQRTQWMLPDVPESHFARALVRQRKSFVVFAGAQVLTPLVASPAPEDDLTERFEKLSSIWFEETLASSSLVEICSHWAYQRIIGLGPNVVPNILRAVANGQRHWGWALAAITGENPAEHTESPKAAAAAWLRWAQEREFVTDRPDNLD